MFWTHQEGAEHGDGGQEVPDVMIIKEGEQDALTVVLARLRWSFLVRHGLVNITAHR